MEYLSISKDPEQYTDHEYVLAYTGKTFQAFRGIDKDYKGYSNPDNDPRGPWTTNRKGL